MFWLVGTDIDHRPAPKKKSKVDVANTTDSDGKPVVSANRANQMVCLSSLLSSSFISSLLSCLYLRLLFHLLITAN